MVQEELYQRMAKVETKIEDHSKAIEKQHEKNDTLTRLVTLMEKQTEDSKERERRQELRDEKQNAQMEKFSDTLVKVNKNLDNLNSKQEQLDERVTGIEGNLSKQNLSIIDIIKYVGATLLGLAVGYISMKLGL